MPDGLAKSDLDLFPPEVAARYEIVRPLGRGGMGDVFLARHREMRAPVAIKLLRNRAEPELVERFLRECEVLASIDHPGIVPVHEYGVGDGGPYLVMSFVRGKGLDESPLPKDPPRFFAALADSLGALHAQGLVHRDIKPANVMVTAEQEPMLIDFGVVLVEDRANLTAAGGLLGTLAYMAPELLQAKRATPASDWYAWAATAYKTLEGDFAYTTGDLFAAAASARLDPPRLGKLREYPGLAEAVVAALRFRPEDRPPNVRALKDLIQGDGSGMPVMTTAAGLARIVQPAAGESEDTEARGHFAAGLAMRDALDAQGAQASFVRAVEADPDNAAARRELAIELLSSGRTAEALAEFERALQVAPEDPESLRFAGRAAERLGQNERAAGYFRRFLAVCPPEQAIARRDAALRLEANQVPEEDAISTFVPMALARSAPGGYSGPPLATAMSSAPPRSAGAVAPPGSVAGIPRCAGPRAVAETLTEVDRFYVEALEALAAGDAAGAEELLRRAVLRDETYQRGWRELAIAVLDAGRSGEALVPFERALRLDPKDYELRRFYAEALRSEGRGAQAEIELTRFLSECPTELAESREEARVTLEAWRSGPEIAPEAPPPAAPGVGDAAGSTGAESPPDSGAAAGGTPAITWRRAGPVAAGAAVCGLVLAWALTPSGPRVRVPRDFVTDVAAIAGEVELPAGAPAALRAAAAQTGRTVQLPREAFETLIASLAATDSPKAVKPVYSLLSSPEAGVRDRARAELLASQTKSGALVIAKIAWETRDLPGGKVFPAAVAALKRHPSGDGPRRLEQLVRRFDELTVTRDSDTLARRAIEAALGR